MAETNEALAEAGLKLKNENKIRHMVEVLIEDRTFFYGRPAQSGGKHAVVIT